jgi:hypothetical protein
MNWLSATSLLGMQIKHLVGALPQHHQLIWYLIHSSPIHSLSRFPTFVKNLIWLHGWDISPQDLQWHQMSWHQTLVTSVCDRNNINWSASSLYTLLTWWVQPALLPCLQLAFLQTKIKNLWGDQYHKSELLQKNKLLCMPCSWVPLGCSIVIDLVLFVECHGL